MYLQLAAQGGMSTRGLTNAGLELAQARLIWPAPLRIRFNRIAEFHQNRNSVGNGIRRGDALLPAVMLLDGGQRRDRRPERRAFVGLQAFQRPVEHGGQDLAHQRAAGDAARDGDPCDLLARGFVLANPQGNQISQRFQSGAEFPSRLCRDFQ